MKNKKTLLRPPKKLHKGINISAGSEGSKGIYEAQEKVTPGCRDLSSCGILKDSGKINVLEHAVQGWVVKEEGD